MAEQHHASQRVVEKTQRVLIYTILTVICPFGESVLSHATKKVSESIKIDRRMINFFILSLPPLLSQYIQ